MTTVTQAARVFAVVLALMSITAMAGALVAVGHQQWDRIAVMGTVMVLLAWASAAERVAWKAGEHHELDVWLAAWPTHSQGVTGRA